MIICFTARPVCYAIPPSFAEKDIHLWHTRLHQTCSLYSSLIPFRYLVQSLWIVFNWSYVYTVDASRMCTLVYESVIQYMHSRCSIYMT